MRRRTTRAGLTMTCRSSSRSSGHGCRAGEKRGSRLRGKLGASQRRSLRGRRESARIRRCAGIPGGCLPPPLRRPLRSWLSPSPSPRPGRPGCERLHLPRGLRRALRRFRWRAPLAPVESATLGGSASPTEGVEATLRRSWPGGGSEKRSCWARGGRSRVSLASSRSAGSAMGLLRQRPWALTCEAYGRLARRGPRSCFVRGLSTRRRRAGAIRRRSSTSSSGFQRMGLLPTDAGTVFLRCLSAPMPPASIFYSSFIMGGRRVPRRDVSKRGARPLPRLEAPFARLVAGF